MPRTGMSFNIISEALSVQRDIDIIQNKIIPRAERDALNSTNVTIRAKIIREAQGLFNEPNQKTLRRQIRIPKFARATLNKSTAEGFFDVVMPAIRGFSGSFTIVRKSTRQPLPDTAIFVATMKSGHTGWFVRAPAGTPGHKRPARFSPTGGVKWRSELPIWEVFVEVDEALRPIVEEALQGSQELFKQRAESRFRDLLFKFRGR